MTGWVEIPGTINERSGLAPPNYFERPQPMASNGLLSSTVMATKRSGGTDTARHQVHIENSDRRTKR
jgi:hypothetical protein